MRQLPLPTVLPHWNHGGYVTAARQEYLLQQHRAIVRSNVTQHNCAVAYATTVGSTITALRNCVIKCATTQLHMPQQVGVL